jgi:hypothetical protein
MEQASPYLALIAEIPRVLFAPLIELGSVFEDLDMASAAAASGTRLDRLRVEFNRRLEGLYQERELLLQRIERGQVSPQDADRLRNLASDFWALRESYLVSMDGDHQVDEITYRAATQLEGWAKDLESAFQDKKATYTNMPDPKVLTALDRLGFTLENLSGLTHLLINTHYKERARRFHPDTKDASDKAFYEEEMKKLNEAKDLLLQLPR